MTTITTTCGLCENPLEDGGFLCLGCVKSTRVRLECLPDLYDALAANLIPSSSGPAGRSGTVVHAPMPVAEAALTMRGPGGMVSVTEDWLTAVHEERGFTVPPQIGSVEGRLRAATAGLRGQMPWIVVSWPLAGVFATEIRELADTARSVIDPRVKEPRGARLGLCPAEFADGSRCKAVLRLAPGATVVRCAWCSSSYPPALWPGLKVLIDAGELESA